MADRKWCETHRWQDVEDEFVEDTGDSRVTVTEFKVVVLACGCSVESGHREYPSPLQQAGPTKAMRPMIPDGWDR